MELLQNDGASALARAKDRSDKFAPHSDSLSAISREARLLADELEAQTEVEKKNAQEANDKANKAYELAKDAINLQKSINEEFKTNISTEMGMAKSKLDTVTRMTDEALEMANKVYDDALTLFANVNSLTAPDINLDEIKKESAKSAEEVKRIRNELRDLINNSDQLLNDVDSSIEFAEVLHLR